MAVKTKTVKKTEKKIDTSNVTSDEIAAIRASLNAYLGSCGIYGFQGLYKIDSPEKSRAVLEIAQKKNGCKGWNIYVICASSPAQTTVKFKADMKKAGWEVIKEFPEAHPAGREVKMMTLWGGLAIKDGN